MILGIRKNIKEYLILRQRKIEMENKYKQLELLKK